MNCGQVFQTKLAVSKARSAASSHPSCAGALAAVVYGSTVYGGRVDRSDIDVVVYRPSALDEVSPFELVFCDDSVNLTIVPASLVFAQSPDVGQVAGWEALLAPERFWVNVAPQARRAITKRIGVVSQFLVELLCKSCLDVIAKSKTGAVPVPKAVALCQWRLSAIRRWLDGRPCLYDFSDEQLEYFRHVRIHSTQDDANAAREEVEGVLESLPSCALPRMPSDEFLYELAWTLDRSRVI